MACVFLPPVAFSPVAPSRRSDGAGQEAHRASYTAAVGQTTWPSSKAIASKFTTEIKSASCQVLPLSPNSSLQCHGVRGMQKRCMSYDDTGAAYDRKSGGIQMKTPQSQRVQALCLLSAGVLLGTWLWLSMASAQERGGVLRIGMTAADIPFTGGIPDQGFEGYRFIGYPLYEALIHWDLSQGERLADLVPGLAESWEVRADDPTKWIFKLRRGVKFHDGTDFNADAVLWNWDKVRTKDAPQYDARQAGFVAPRITVMQSWRKLDAYTVEFTTTRPSSFVPYQVMYVLYTSPTQWEKVGRDWRAFANNPAGTGPFKLTRLVPRERAELEPNQDYWDKTRIPRVDKVILLPMPEATTRLAALRTGQVDWIEVPPPDAIPSLRQAGFQIFLRSYPHNWTHTLNLSRPPWDNKAVRQAANYAIDREGLCKSLLNDTCIPAIGEIYPGHPWFGNPTQRYEYNPTKARELLNSTLANQAANGTL